MAFSGIVCGPKCSICCSLISVWGIIMLAIMGVLLQAHSLTFAEDLVEEIKETNSIDEFVKQAEEKYENAAKTCYMAAGLYLFTFVFSLFQVWLNKKNSRF